MAHSFSSKQVSFHFMAAVILETKKRKSVTVSFVSPSIFHKAMGSVARILDFESWVLSQVSLTPLSTSSRGSLIPLHSLSLGWCYLHIQGYWYFSWQSWLELVLLPAFLMMYSECKLNKQGYKESDMTAWLSLSLLVVLGVGLGDGPLGWTPGVCQQE